MGSNLATVQEIYGAFGRGDVPAILASLADDVAWEDWEDNAAQAAGVPWLEARSGPDGALGFFQVVGTWTPTRFAVLSLLESPAGDKVVAEVEAGFTLPSGASLADQELHLWTFNEDGKVSAFRHYVDTAKHIAAAKI